MSVDILLDTDMGNDIDDALALVMLHAMGVAGECRVLGISISKGNPWAPVYTRLVNERCGRNKIPLGMVRNGPTPEEGNFLRAVSQKVGVVAPPKEEEEAVRLLRRLLVSSEDNSVTVLSIGFFTNLARLLDSSPDAVSPLDGEMLFSRKVRQVVSMAGTFVFPDRPELDNPEFNVRMDVPATRRFIAGCPCPMVFSGFEIGKQILISGVDMEVMLASYPGDVVALGYAFYLPMSYDRPAWDQTAVLQAVRPDAGYFDLSKPGRVEIDESGYSSFIPVTGGKHRHLILRKEQVERVRNDINTLCFTSLYPEDVRL